MAGNNFIMTELIYFTGFINIKTASLKQEIINLFSISLIPKNFKGFLFPLLFISG